ncbi:unnamed protein product [Caenorhabditis auriculariae]|uniref:Uncharacterized protein n=1 Tax=Caenorhabditis auriculariae TaxID=2777116 RepID=A0A8S1GTI2_9PELO|nr:unnamed protein product [Caenorhabditis auriculariae]
MLKRCAICDDAGDGLHFSAVACRACAAFFRRSVAMGRTYSCRGATPCAVRAKARKLCRACRYSRCLAAGMKPSEVQSQKGSDSLPLVYSVGPSCPSDIPMISESTSTPILNRLNETYKQLEGIRKIFHRRPSDSLFRESQSRATNNDEMNEMYQKEATLVADFISNCFPDFSTLPSDQKIILFKNFYLAYVLLEGSYLTYASGRSDRITLPCGDYIDLVNPELFYVDLDNKEVITPAEAAKIFHPIFDFFHRSLIKPMILEKIDRFEFFFLVAIILWDQGLENMTEESQEVCRKSRESLFSEINIYYSRVRRIEEPSFRIAHILVLLPALQRCVSRYEEDVEVSLAFNFYVSEDFSKFIPANL